MDLGLEGRVALVSGAGRGIGRAVALALAHEGVDVALLSRTRTELEAVAAQVRGLGRRAEVLAVDVCELEALDRALEESKLGPPTLVVLGTSALWQPRKLQFVSDAEARKLLETDLHSAVALCHRALPGMMDARFGRIVALSSLAAHTGIPGGSLYSTAKAGLEGLVRGLAVDYGRRGITANALSIGFVDTERLAQRLQGDDAARERLAEQTARRRLLSPEEVADVVTFLCSERASGITGAVVEVTAGAHLSNRW